jgi:hypothetical protein
MSVNAARWLDIDADLASARKHFSEAVRAYRASPARLEPDDYWASMAFQHAMQSGYSSFEAALERTLLMCGEQLPVGRNWHAKLLDRAATSIDRERPAIISHELRSAARMLLAFRHVAMHSYDDFEPVRALPAVEAAELYLSLTEKEFATFRAQIDPA